LSVPEIDLQIGIETYFTHAPGVGGAIRRSVEDFVVEEVLIDGSKATIEKNDSKPALGANLTKQRFLLGVLVKRNWDTFIALKNLAKQLGIPQSCIQIAGIKDAKAITGQHVTIEDISLEDAGKINIKDINVRPIGYFHEPICSFYLLGNSFRIGIKCVNYPKQETQERMEKVVYELNSAGGIPNFYGHQRFGTTRAITHLVGKALVQGNMQEAAMTLLARPSIYEHPGSMNARAELQANQDFKQALQNFPVQLRFERMMLGHLVDYPGDFSGAFKRLPLKLRMLFVQAWQSFLFNRFLSSRIKNGFSLCKAEVGDYVVNVERSGLPLIRSGKIVDSNNLAETNKSINTGKLRIALPIFGAKQKLSKGAIGEIEAQILEEENVEAQEFRVPLMPEISGKGELRAAICPIRNFNHLICHDKDTKELSEAFLDFTLLRGAYATILLREIMKPEDLIKAGF
jgi:tRNA pseudouridine13 synthase